MLGIFIDSETSGSLSSSRIDLGCIQDFQGGQTFKIEGGLENWDTLTIKIVEDSGKILGRGRFRPIGKGGAETESLLSFRIKDLGSIPWKLEFYPTLSLYVNSRIPEGRNFFQTHPLIMAIILPEVVRSIYRHIYFFSEVDFTEDGTWVSDWMGLAAAYNGNEEIPERSAPEEEIKIWIEGLVEDFSSSHQFVEDILGVKEANEG